jgi:hypothetical protein
MTNFVDTFGNGRDRGMSFDDYCARWCVTMRHKREPPPRH